MRPLTSCAICGPTGTPRPRAKAADSGVLTIADPGKELTADVFGASLVRLTVTDAGDGVDSDHSDWADAQITCA